MIHPDKISIEAKKKEDENFKFRSYLKGHANEDELDQQFARLHKELFAGFLFGKGGVWNWVSNQT